ncbi:MAG TPA: universal stress protein [Paracoccaceae bacterium]|nr:universal stress protein [Paracoccaceae bacterium]
MPGLLVATDLSERADRAVERAFLVAAEIGAEVTILTAVDDSLPESVRREAAERARDRLSSHIASLAVSQGVPRQVRVESGEPHRVIPRVAAEIDPDLIVLGMHRVRGLLDLFGGSTVERVTRGGVWPVLLVRDHPDRAYARALIGVDFSDAAGRAVRLVRRLMPKAERRFFHAYTVPFKGLMAAGVGEVDQAAGAEAQRHAEATRHMAAFMAETGETGEPIVAEGSFVATLEKAMETIHPDLIAIGGHEGYGIIRAILGSAVDDLMIDPPCDLLVA